MTREDVISWLEYLSDDARSKVDGLIPTNIEIACGMAIEALKAQEPRVMTLEEVKQERICWIEDADDGMTVRLFPATMIGIGEYANGSKSYIFLAERPRAIDENNYEWWYLIADYGEIWRCWTSRPTDEQRGKEPWNG